MYEYIYLDSFEIEDRVEYEKRLDFLEKNKIIQNSFSITPEMKMDIFHSTKIEGNSMNMFEMTNFLSNEVTIRGKSFRDHLQAINYESSLKEIVKILNKGQFTLTEDTIKEMHYLVTCGELSLKESGQFRQEPVHIRFTDHIPPMETEVPELIRQLCDEYNRPLGLDTRFERICEFKLNFEKIHPFIDGNGRTGRLLMNMLLLQEGYNYFSVPAHERDLYFESLETNSFADFASKKAVELTKEYLKERGEKNYDR